MKKTSFVIIAIISILTVISIPQFINANTQAKIKPLQINKPLIAYWNFDESSGVHCIDISGNGYDAVSQRGQSPGFERIEELFNMAMNLSGNHILSLPGNFAVEEISYISFSAWVKPAKLNGFREIFRKDDGNNRLLFSFQNNGTILALGLNIGSYVECDGQIDPKRVLDGAWHHCAATFDGQFMRVYLDGEIVGELEQPGKIKARGNAVAFIGSSNGNSEFFQGGLDDLRIYSESLTSGEIAELHENGVKSEEERIKEITKLANSIYTRESSFAATIAHTRENFWNKSLNSNRVVAWALMNRLSNDFPEEYERFFQFTNATANDYLMSSGNDFHLRTLDMLVKLMVEYKPLTASQWKQQTPEQIEQWILTESIAQKFEALKASGEEIQFSPRWIETILEIGSLIQFRPRVAEAVAPYIEPDTPQTCTLADDEARKTLQFDWLHQADGAPTPKRIQQEISWAREMADRIKADYPGQVDFTTELSQLNELQTQTENLSSNDEQLYFQVRKVKRAMMFKNPVIDFDQVLFVDMPFPAGSEWPHETRHRLGYMAVPGGKIVVIKGLSPYGVPRKLAPQEPLHGSFWRPDLSFDGQKVLFCFKPHNEKAFHLYEIGINGADMNQLTYGPYDDLDPIYLPDDEHIIFSTTRGHTYVRCMPPTSSFVLAQCQTDGQNVYLISRNNEPDYLPSVMNDGRVIYTRWEYTDKPLWRAQSLWTIYPDGTQANTFWGNQTVWPDLLKDARNIPGSSRVMFTGSAHHDWFSGSVGIIDPTLGLNFPDGLTKVTAETPWPESGNGPVDPVESPRYHTSGKYTAYYSPYPLSEKDFLVSAERGSKKHHKFLLYLMDVDGNRELIYEGDNNIFHAQPVRSRIKPQVIPDRVAWPSTEEEKLNPQDGVMYSRNVYEGAPPELRGKAKYMRIMNIEPKTYTYWHKRPYASTGPVVSMVQSDGVKRILGTVPIEKDGSMSFYAPTGKALHFQLLDEKYRALQTMRSFTGVMPGERRSCLGCHSLHNTMPGNSDKANSIALSSAPHQITPPPWPDHSVDYERYVQPTLDKYCGSCHQGEGKARETLDLTLRPGYLIFKEPYVTLTGRPSWGTPYVRPENPPPGFGIANTILVEGYSTIDPEAYQTSPPMTYLSYKSRLVEIASSGKHHGVQVDPINLRRLMVWIDAMCPYRGAEEVRAIPDPEFQGIDWLSVRPKINSAPVIIRPGPVE